MLRQTTINHRGGFENRLTLSQMPVSEPRHFQNLLLESNKGAPQPRIINYAPYLVLANPRLSLRPFKLIFFLIRLLTGVLAVWVLLSKIDSGY